MKKSNTYFFIFLLITSSFGCTKEQFCNNKDLCDLLSNTILPATGVILGVNLSVVSSVYNVAAANVDCTEDAEASNSEFGVEFRTDGSQSWQVIQDVSNQVLQVNSLVAGSDSDDTEVTMNFNMPGQYRFKTAADYDLKVEERAEDNNGSCAGCMPIVSDGNNVSYSEVLTVYENPDIPIDYSKPMVEIVSIKKLN